MSTIEIPLTQGKSALVLTEDLPLVAHLKWHAVKARATFYAASWNHGNPIYMHRLVAGVHEIGRKVFVDHIDFNGLNNTRANLRACTPLENAQHRRAEKDYLGMRGVWKKGSKYIAQLGHKGRFIYLGSFDTEREAGIAYHAASVALAKSFSSQ